MDLLLGALIFLPFLTVVIAIHELGHFYFARRFGMKVTEYFVGFGPRKIWSRRKGELEYGVKPIFIGGYVKIAGMNPYEENPPEDVPRLYASQPIWQRAITIFAGPGTHFVVAALIFAVWLAIFGDPRTAPLAPLVIDEVEVTLNGAESPAAAAGIEPGDLILRLGEVDEPTAEQLTDVITSQVEDRPGEPLTLLVERGGETVTLTVVPELAEVDGETRGRMGIIVGPPDPEPVAIGAALVGGVKEVDFAVRESFSQIGRVFGPEGVGRVFGLLFNDEQRRPDDAASVVGISQQVGATSSAGDWSTIVYLFGFVTVFVGLINLVPLPPFDGGHLLTLAIEKVRGRAVDMRTLIPISAAVMAFFVMFVGATIVLDVTKPISLP
ncbi:MAG: RIP metalloprotease [Actinomycetota bacterium]|nr:RIP metalloprotease [Actinomycetota bacterium]MDH5224439.1 RIP metalloprotease [Actinomycetota bacterium]MDH5312826.1 RIP metalloprotease [Actinomycetota bacterium]